MRIFDGVTLFFLQYFSVSNELKQFPKTCKKQLLPVRLKVVDEPFDYSSRMNCHFLFFTEMHMWPSAGKRSDYSKRAHKVDYLKAETNQSVDLLVTP